MGLAGVSLGEYYSMASGNRCPNVNAETGSRCAIEVGHKCSHARGKETWPLTLMEVLTPERLDFATCGIGEIVDFLDEAWPQAGGRHEILLTLAKALSDEMRVT
jgi:malonyl CoA-acyl carrier protein transacylase